MFHISYLKTLVSAIFGPLSHHELKEQHKNLLPILLSHLFQRRYRLLKYEKLSVEQSTTAGHLCCFVYLNPTLPSTQRDRIDIYLPFNNSSKRISISMVNFYVKKRYNSKINLAEATKSFVNKIQINSLCERCPNVAENCFLAL